MIQFILDAGNGMLDRLANIQSLEDRLAGFGKAVDLVDDWVELVDFRHDLISEVRAEVGVVVAFGEKLRERLDGDKRVADLMAHAGGQLVPECGAFELFFFFL